MVTEYTDTQGLESTAQWAGLNLASYRSHWTGFLK